MFYWNDSAYIRRDSNELILQGLKSRVRVKISDLSTNLFEQLAKQNMIDETNLEAREQRFLLRLNELGFLETEEYELESPHSRTARFLSYYSDAPLTLLKQIGAVHLAIVGMGGIGQVVAEHLAAAGVRHFTLIDGDRVERSNVNRQFLVGPDEIGEAKVEAVSKTLVNRYPDLSLNPVASYVRSAEELMRCVPSRTSMLVCAADSGEGVNPRSIVLEACIEKDIPCAFCAVGVADGEIGPILEKQSDMKSYLSFLQRAEENSCAPQGERNKAAGVPWRFRYFPCYYCGGSRVGRLGLLCSRRFYSIRVCAYLAVARRFMRLVLCWVVAPLICNLGYGGLSFDAGGDAG